MSIAQQIDQFFKATGQSVFIEAEAKESRMLRFIQEYNTNYIPNINLGTDGIIALDEGADKRGLELRCYFENDMGFPVMNMVRGNRAYRPMYPCRFNDVDVILELFSMGYRIGQN